MYVFALLKHQDKNTIDPLNVDQWEFYVVPTADLDRRVRSQYGITLPSLIKLCTPVDFNGLQAAVSRAAHR